MSALTLFAGAGETLADRLEASAQARVLLDLVKDAQAAADEALRDSVDALSASTGTAFTARGDGRLAGWSAQITAPQPKPYVTDEHAFSAWWVGKGWPHERVSLVEVVDHAAAADVVTAYHQGGDVPVPSIQSLMDCLKVVTETLLPEDAAEQAAKGATPVEAGYVDASGELIPGLGWRQQTPQLRVVGSKDAKQSARAALVDVLGIPAELAVSR